MSKVSAFDVHQAVTDHIIAAIEAGVGGDVRMPWHRPGMFSMLPRNAEGTHYQGINILLLLAQAQMRGFSNLTFATYKAWKEAGAQVRKGEKANLIVFYKQYSVDPDPENTDDDGSRKVARAYSVFNVAQVDGYELPAIPERPPIQKHAEAEAFFRHLGIALVTGGENAFYRPSDDSITMPDERYFDASTEEQRTLDWLSVIFHEAGHATGAKHRLNRDLGKRFGSPEYAGEELVAELISAYTMAYLGLSAQPRDDHARYIANWLKALKDDKRAIFTAAARAQEALAWMIARQPGASAATDAA
ncbi:zincin-like metallopeptidase domain-containing protein [Hyphomicrobium sp. CS1BSMeth3]|uniref:ArdC family protein n=1 Tax=Hyphomicrobium sp. CS1BSMeth3 TaxID=1892844 RepID=UPI000931825F|nr:zincin-like metallopeptidase domain-containing protein [Hyphomicrobium sp. CS1BSMeth3]